MAGIADVVTVQTALGDTPFEPSPSWTDQREIVEAATSRAGRGGTFDRYRASSLEVTFDNTANTIDVLTWYRWRQVRLVSLGTGTEVVLAHGHIDDPTHEVGSQSPFKFTGSLPCVDGVGLFARRELNDEPIPGGSSTEVITYLATLAGLPTPTFVGMSSVPIAPRSEASGNVLEILQDVLDTESGVIVRQPQAAPLQLEVRGRYAPLIAWQDSLDDGPKCRFRGNPTPMSTPTEVGIRRASIPLRPASESYRDDITGKTVDEFAYTLSEVPEFFPASSLSRDLWTRNKNWVRSTVDMWLKTYRQEVAAPEKVTVLCATASGPLEALAAVQSLRFGDVVQVDTVSVADFLLTVENISWRLTRQELSAEIGLAFPLMGTYYGGIDQYSQVGSAVVGTSKVAP